MTDIPSWAVRGAKVVCVNVGPATSISVYSAMPGKGQIYTIRRVNANFSFWDGSYPAVWLDEVVRDESLYGPDADFPFGLWRFRPLVTRSQDQDIEQFRKLLTNLPADLLLDDAERELDRYTL